MVQPRGAHRTGCACVCACHPHVRMSLGIESLLLLASWRRASGQGGSSHLPRAVWALFECGWAGKSFHRDVQFALLHAGPSCMCMSVLYLCMWGLGFCRSWLSISLHQEMCECLLGPGWGPERSGLPVSGPLGPGRHTGSRTPRGEQGTPRTEEPRCVAQMTHSSPPHQKVIRNLEAARNS